MVCGLQPNLHMLKNECSVTMKYFIREAGTKHQLLPPGLHQSLIAEMEIQTFKPPPNCRTFKSQFNPPTPLHLWDRIIIQAEITLIILHPDRMNPLLPTEANLNMAFDLNRTQLAPPGTWVLIFEVPTKKYTFAQNFVGGWYWEPAPYHYRCYTIYVRATHKERIIKIVELLPQTDEGL